MNLNFNILDKSILYRVTIALQRKTHHVLYYHLLGKPDKKYEYYYNQSIPQISLFLDQLKWLKSMGFKPVSVQDFLENPEAYVNQKTFSLSTDDGYADTFDTLVPIIEEQKIPCIFFLCNKVIDNIEFLWKDRLFYIMNKSSESVILKSSNELETKFGLMKLEHFKSIADWIETWPMEKVDEISRNLWDLIGFQDERIILEEIRPYFNTEQIQMLLSNGFEIGSHTFSHMNLVKLPDNMVFHEVVDSVSELRKRFNTRIDFFSYPYGSRVRKGLEKELIDKSGTKIFFGTTNFSNHPSSHYWGRDPMEMELNKSKIWFSMVPLVRKFLLNPIKSGNRKY